MTELLARTVARCVLTALVYSFTISRLKPFYYVDWEFIANEINFNVMFF